MSTQIKLTALQLNRGTPFELADFAELENRTQKCFICSDFKSINYHYTQLCKENELKPIIIDDENEVLDGYHRIAAIAYYNHTHDDQIDTIDCIVQ